jgi:hypothetical protein
MTRDRRSDRVKPSRPPDRGGHAWAMQAIGKVTLTLNGRIHPTLIAQSCGRRGRRFLIAVWNVLIRHRQKTQRQSIPIALVPGGAV